MPYLDADQYDTSSPEWRDICLARWICSHDKERRHRLLRLFRPRHGEQLADIAREQWARRTEWLPAHRQGEVEHANRHRAAEAADRPFRETYVFRTHAEIATELGFVPKKNPAATPDATVVDGDDIHEFGMRTQAEPPPFEPMP